MVTVLFPLDVRLSTWITLAIFGLLAATRRDRRFWLAAAGWLGGFEVAFQVTALAMRHPLPALRWGPFFLIGLGLLVVALVSRRNVLPSPALMALVAGIWLVWLLTGFHANDHRMAGFDPTAEALNEAAKTAWALAYLWPLGCRRWSWWPRRRPDELVKSPPPPSARWT